MRVVAYRARQILLKNLSGKLNFEAFERSEFNEILPKQLFRLHLFDMGLLISNYAPRWLVSISYQARTREIIDK